METSMAMLKEFSLKDGIEPTKETFINILRHANASHDAVRDLLNSFLAPQLRATFDSPPRWADAGLRGVDFLDVPDTQGLSRPMRLIDVETGNLIDSWKASRLDSYCMLSHRWQGEEVTLAHIKRARDKLFEGSEDSFSQDGDMEIVRKQCIIDIQDQRKVIEDLLKKKNEATDISTLIRRKAEANELQTNANSARDKAETMKARAKRCKMEEDMFESLIKQAGYGIKKDTTGAPAEESGSSPPELTVKEAEESSVQADLKLQEAMAKRDEDDNSVVFFQEKRLLENAIQKLISLIQLWRSAIKLKQSMAEAKRIFEEKNFPHTGACYIWSDTCCIDKLNYGELAESLSLMGDWYENAEFTLVFLDASSKESNASIHWDEFLAEMGEGDSTAAQTSFDSFEAIKAAEKAPEWSTRAWTLQELVMSKMTFFANAQWEPLSRPIEDIGYVYPLIPFVELYTSRTSSDQMPADDEPTDVLIKDLRNRNVLPEIQESDTAEDKVKKASDIIKTLHASGFRFPINMTLETCMSQMAEAIFIAADDQFKRAQTGQDLSQFAVSTEYGVERLRKVIKILLEALVTAVKDLVRDDRTAIAKFGCIPHLEQWKQGIMRSGFPAKVVLELSCDRQATKAIDHVYSLMGVLGVRFEAFPAEGYPKALSRLLDQVVITHCDVSVFNWSGVELGSPIQGRSLYPSSHKAYKTDEDPGQKYNRFIAAESRRAREEIMRTHLGVIQLLRETIECVKENVANPKHVQWVEMIVAAMRKMPLDYLGKELERLGSVIEYIKDAQKPKMKEKIASPPQSPVSPKARLSLGLGRSSSKYSLRSSLLGASVGVQDALGMSEKPKEAEDVEEAGPGQSVEAYLEHLSQPNNGEDPKYPEGEVLSHKFTFEQREQINREPEKNTTPTINAFACPNPIIVNNSGIEGIMDIHRVIVTMLDTEKLAQQVAHATSPKQRISGWCTVSTGFANVAVNFACEKRLLATQLQVGQAIADMLHVEGETEWFPSTKPAEANGAATAPGSDKAQVKEDQAQEQNPARTPEERRIARKIEFIQEKQLDLVAGEWVLARFSGVPDSKWFLCALELGSTHQFYGHRIAASDIDFRHSAAEPGLLEIWKTYMQRKKSKMCKILERYIESRKAAHLISHRFDTTRLLGGGVRHNTEPAGDDSPGRLSLFGRSLSDGVQTINGTAEKNDETVPLVGKTEHKSPGDLKYGLDAPVNLLFDALEEGVDGILGLGEVALLAAYQGIYKMKADSLDRRLARSALKKTPPSLRPAVESIEENAGFLPSMFYSSQRVHMF